MPQDNTDSLTGEFILNGSSVNHADMGETGTSSSKPSGNLKFYSSLCIYPKNFTFASQEEDEEIVLFIRRDLITNVPWIIIALLLILVPPLIIRFLDLFSPFFSVSSQTGIVLILFFYLIVSGFVLIQFSLWFFSIGIVTNKRIIDFNLSGILFKSVSETKLNLVEDVSYSQIGAVRSIFDYGDVSLQTAGTQENFILDRVPDPAKIVKVIADMIGGPR